MVRDDCATKKPRNGISYWGRGGSLFAAVNIPFNRVVRMGACERTLVNAKADQVFKLRLRILWLSAFRCGNVFLIDTWFRIGAQSIHSGVVRTKRNAWDDSSLAFLFYWNNKEKKRVTVCFLEILEIAWGKKIMAGHHWKCVVLVKFLKWKCGS